MNPAQKRAFLESIGMIAKDESSESGEGFDGGVRQPVPSPSNPELDHNRTVLDLIQRTERRQPWR